MTVYNIHHFSTFNTGDRNCGVGNYFPLDCEIKDIWSFRPEPESAVIYGGGGLLHSSYRDIIGERASVPGLKTVLWGIGTNTHGVESDPYPGWLKNCMVGMRDADSGHRWVPCPSCMSPLFDVRRTPSREVVVYKHYLESVLPPVNAPVMMNWIDDAPTVEIAFQRALDFLGSAEYVVTDTYHGAYWATLLGRKVIVYPYSTRHRKLKHKVVLIEREDPRWWRGKRSARSYPEALEECRQANKCFFEDVIDFIS